MFKKSVFLTMALTCLAPSMSQAQTHDLVSSTSMTYEFPPNDPQILKNELFWEVNATCKISTTDESDELHAKGLNKEGKINGIHISKGDQVSVLVHQGDKLKISAKAGAKIEITNYGIHKVVAKCST